jgi:hypothetical protein
MATLASSLVSAFEEDDTLRLFGNAVAAERQYEGVDVESGGVKFFGADGTVLEPVFTVPNRSGKLLGLFAWVQSGAYRLVPSPDAGKEAFASRLRDARALQSNPWYASMADLRAALARRGVLVQAE